MTEQNSSGGRQQLPYSGPSIRVTRFKPGLPKVLMLHDVPVIIETTKALLSDQAEVIAVTHSGQFAVSLSQLLSPDVVIVGDTVSDGVTEHYIPGLLQTGTRVLHVSHQVQASNVMDLVGIGITGIIDGGNSPEQIVNAVVVLAAGGAFLPADVVAAIAADWRRGRTKGTIEAHGTQLTERELEVMGSMSDGLSTKAIAHHLGISVKTVENHKTRIFDKLGVRSQAQAVALIHRKGEGVHSGPRSNAG